MNRASSKRFLYVIVFPPILPKGFGVRIDIFEECQIPTSLADVKFSN